MNLSIWENPAVKFLEPLVLFGCHLVANDLPCWRGYWHWSSVSSPWLPVKNHPEIPMGLPLASSAYKRHSALTISKKLNRLRNQQLF